MTHDATWSFLTVLLCSIFMEQYITSGQWTFFESLLCMYVSQENCLRKSGISGKIKLYCSIIRLGPEQGVVHTNIKLLKVLPD